VKSVEKFSTPAGFNMPDNSSQICKSKMYFSKVHLVIIHFWTRWNKMHFHWNEEL